MNRITKATLEHLPILMQIGSKTLHESHGRSAPAHVMNAYVDEKFSEASLREELMDQDTIFHIIFFNNIPAGYSKIIYNIPIEPVKHSNLTKMERLYLLEEFHGLKLGHELLKFNVALSIDHKQAGMWLYVWKENHKALRFYERQGFKIVGDGMFRLTDEHSNPNWQMYLKYG